jgi:hypothetical protein
LRPAHQWRAREVGNLLRGTTEVRPRPREVERAIVALSERITPLGKG